MLVLLGYQLVRHVCQVTMLMKLVLFTVCAVQLDTVVQMLQSHLLHAFLDTIVMEGTYHVHHALQAEDAQMLPLMNHCFALQGFFHILHQQNV